ncbi:MAG: serine/threonine protein kinase [Actinomycetota bacterium]|nr:serine/threonine protein kinase [Actinomycetota bacterium]
MSLPSRLGRLRQVSRLGVGGFASVWLYHDDELDSSVAVKALADNWCQRADVRQRFLDEARIMRRADSDHVVRVYDVGETEDGTPYFVMSYADQGTVADLITQAPRPAGEVADLVQQAGQGLTVLHRIGVIHRDIKPQNLLLRTTDVGETRLLVADLGVAKAVAFVSGLTQVVGTPAYMAPEQADPTRGLDVRADVHALGAVAYHLLTGVPLREASMDAVLRPRLPAPPSSIVPGLPTAVDDVVGRAVMPAREDRWDDVTTFAKALCAVSAPPVTGADASPPWDHASSVRPTLSASTAPTVFPTGRAGHPTSVRQHAGTAPARGSRVVAFVAGVVVASLLAGIAAVGWAVTREPVDPVLASDRIDPDLPRGWAEDSRTDDTVVYTDDEDQRLTIELSTVPESPEEYLDAVNERDRALAEYLQQFFYSLELEQISSWQAGSQLAYTFGRDTETVGREIWAVGDVETTEAVVTLETILVGESPSLSFGDNDPLMRAAVAGIER